MKRADKTYRHGGDPLLRPGVLGLWGGRDERIVVVTDGPLSTLVAGAGRFAR